jgi:peptide/nickel transport system substrate-binding protein
VRINFRKSVVMAAAAVVTMVSVAACSAGAGAGNRAASGGASGTLSVGFLSEPASLDFTRSDGAAIPQALLYNVYETLVKVDQTGRVVPSLAKSWDVSPDRKTYTFHLVDNAKFSNGAPFTADDAKFSIDRVETDAWTISLKSAMNVVARTTAVSPTVLQVALSEPSNDWLYRMTTRVGAMFSRTGVSDLANKPMGTGPYAFASWTRGDSITLTRRDDYWGAKPYYARAVLKYFKDPTAEDNALLSGTINVISAEGTPESLGQFENNPKYQVLQGTSNSELQLSLNNGSGPMSNLKMRQAVRYGIDHQALMNTCWAGKGKLIGSMVPPTDPWYEDLTGMYPHDPEKAKQLLAESGEADRTLRLRVPTTPYGISCGVVVKSQLEQLGFKIQLDQLEFPAAWITSVFTNADYDMTIVAHVEPRDLGAVFGNPKYYTRYDNPVLRSLLEKADTGTPEEQIAYMQQAARLISQDAAADWLFLLPNLVVADAGITGLPKNAIEEPFDLGVIGRV